MTPPQPYRPLRPGDRVAVVAPSSPVRPEMLAAGLDAVRGLGYEPVLSSGVEARFRFTAGTASRRLSELRGALADDSVRAIWLARGGAGASELLRHLDPAVLRGDPKPFIGESDATALGCWALAAGVSWIHGPMVASALRAGSAGYDAESLQACLTGEGYPRAVAPDGVRTLHQGMPEAVELVLLAGASIFGRVVQSGEAVTGAHVGLIKYSSDLGWGGMDNREASTSEDGSYRIDGLRPGRYTVRLSVVSPDGTAGRQDKFVQVPSEGEVECSFESGGYCKLSGKILRWEERTALIGEGPVKSFIMLVPAGGKERAQDLGHVASDGSFEFQPVPAGDYELQIFGVLPVPITLPGQPELYREVTLPAGNISGSVRRADGKPVGHLMVEAKRRDEPERPGSSTMVRMEGDGTFVFPNLEEGTYDILGDLREAGTGKVEGIELGPGHVLDGVDLVIEEPPR